MRHWGQCIALGAMYCTGGNVLHWGQCIALGAPLPVQFIARGQFIAPHGNKLLPVQEIAPVRAGGEGPPRLRAARGCAPRLRVVVSSDVVHLAAVVLAAIEARTQGGRSLHGGSEGWGSRQRWCTAVAATAGGSGGAMGGVGSGGAIGGVPGAALAARQQAGCCGSTAAERGRPHKACTRSRAVPGPAKGQGQG